MAKKEEADKTVYYILETLKALTENERYLLKRIEKLEGAMSEVATELFGEEEDDDEAEDRIIN
jgi:hypothetical protein|tara:strand:+ start:372 stop:560 length:189 start_codon:yes stop_codon:yes gene_type:complete